MRLPAQKKNVPAAVRERSKRWNRQSASSDCTTSPPTKASIENSAASRDTTPRDDREWVDEQCAGDYVLVEDTFDRYAQDDDGEAEDWAKILRLNAPVSIDFGDYLGCLMTKEYAPLSPGEIEHKFYFRLSQGAA